MNNWKTKVSKEENALIENNLDNLTDLFEQQGEQLFDADMINLGIQSHVVRGGKKAMDALVLYRRRSCMLTNPALIERERIKNPVAAVPLVVPVPVEVVIEQPRKRRNASLPEEKAKRMKSRHLE
jgi:hypothetical protein